jgi:hypothetical protein
MLSSFTQQHRGGGGGLVGGRDGRRVWGDRQEGAGGPDCREPRGFRRLVGGHPTIVGGQVGDSQQRCGDGHHVGPGGGGGQVRPRGHDAGHDRQRGGGCLEKAGMREVGGEDVGAPHRDREQALLRAGGVLPLVGG